MSTILPYTAAANIRIVIVSRHPAAIKFIADNIGATCEPTLEVVGADGLKIHVLSEATIEDVEGAIVYGNIPLSLASFAHAVFAVEFEGTPPRGAEYTLKDMVDAGAYLEVYQVSYGIKD